MNIVSMSLKNLRFRPLSAVFNVLVLALGIATIVALLHVSKEVEDRFSRDAEGVDLVVGAKGSPIQLILSSVFHLDAPTGNIPLADAEKIEHSNLVKSAIPLALGDSYHGFRIVGTTPDYPKHYNASFVAGNYWTEPMQAVLGSEAARASGLSVGQKFTGQHGLEENGEEHAHAPYSVVGILTPTGTVADRLIFTDLASVWNVHEHHDTPEAGSVWDAHDHPNKNDAAPEHAAPPNREITSLLITYRSPLAMASLPRLVNKTGSLQAASPALEMARLIHILGIGGETIRFFGLSLIIIAGAGFFVTLWGAVADRGYDIALMRMLGATRKRIFSFVLAEGLALGILGVGLGLILGHVLAYAAERSIETSRHITLTSIGFHPLEGYVIFVALGLSAVVALIPAVMAYRINVATVLSRGV